MEPKRGAPPLFQLLSKFKNGGTIPQEYAWESPSLAWTGQPSDTKSFALIMEDITVPRHYRVSRSLDPHFDLEN